MTGSAVILLTRPLIEDPDARKWGDADFVKLLNSGQRHIHARRPDFFLGDTSETIPVIPPAEVTLAADELELNESNQMALVYFMAAQCWSDKGSSAKVKKLSNMYDGKYQAELNG